MKLLTLLKTFFLKLKEALKPKTELEILFGFVKKIVTYFDTITHPTKDEDGKIEVQVEDDLVMMKEYTISNGAYFFVELTVPYEGQVQAKIIFKDKKDPNSEKFEIEDNLFSEDETITRSDMAKNEETLSEFMQILEGKVKHFVEMDIERLFEQAPHLIFKQQEDKRTKVKVNETNIDSNSKKKSTKSNSRKFSTESNVAPTKKAKGVATTDSGSVPKKSGVQKKPARKKRDN
jgi:hypothetical protein